MSKELQIVNELTKELKADHSLLGLNSVIDYILNRSWKAVDDNSNITTEVHSYPFDNLGLANLDNHLVNLEYDCKHSSGNDKAEYNREYKEALSTAHSKWCTLHDKKYKLNTQYLDTYTTDVSYSDVLQWLNAIKAMIKDDLEVLSRA